MTASAFDHLAWQQSRRRVQRRNYLAVVTAGWHTYDNPGAVTMCLGLRGHPGSPREC